MRRSSLIAALAVSSALVLSGCAIGFNSPTQLQGNSGNGQSAKAGSLEVRAASIVVDPKNPNVGTIIATILNNSEDKTNAVVGIAATSDLAALSSGAIYLQTKSATQIGYNSTNSIVLSSPTGTLTPGKFITLQFKFQDNDPITVSVLISTNEGPFSGVIIPELPQPTPTPVTTDSATPAPSASPSA